MILALLLGIVLLASGATLGGLLVADRRLDSVATASIIMWCIVVGGTAVRVAERRVPVRTAVQERVDRAVVGVRADGLHCPLV